MSKWGLFLCSLGGLIILGSSNLNSGEYDVLSMISGISFIVIGILIIKNSKVDIDKEE
ncbi:DUF3188 domain-containing protein [Lacticigenium naphthae]|uniref:DUF3188 domain-containing protein n=1 Tax=Lacticigenium naphthae TaxID=515351 RepID=UPI0012EBE74F|nr:DUF3188 domain-containing protein [Lacticigenium naphthae]